MCFIDYSKAFDCVDHERMWNTLRDMGFPEHLIHLLHNLYDNQEAVVRTEFGDTENFGIGKGVRQGCILSPSLFNLYAERVMREAGVEESEAGIMIGGRKLNNLRYADDTTLLATKIPDLQSLIVNVQQASEKAGLSQYQENKSDVLCEDGLFQSQQRRDRGGAIGGEIDLLFSWVRH